MVSLPEQRLRASAMNALAHGADSLYTPLSNPVATMAALRGAALLAKALDTDRAKRDPAQLALGATLCAYALDSAMFALHHVVAQTLVRTFGSRMPRPTRRCCPNDGAMRPRASKQMTGSPARSARSRTASRTGIEALGGGPRRLSELGADRERIDDAVKGMLARPELELTPDPPAAAEIRALIESAW